VLRAADLAHRGVDAGQWVAVDRPQVEQSAGAGAGYVVRQVFDVAARSALCPVDWRIKSQTPQIPDDGRFLDTKQDFTSTTSITVVTASGRFTDVSPIKPVDYSTLSAHFWPATDWLAE
jgi:hypothetical protein